MKYASLFILTGVLLIWRAFAIGGWGYLLLWIGMSFVAVGLAYAWRDPRVFGKRQDGRMAIWSEILLFPYLLLTWGIWHIGRLMESGSAAQQIAPGLWLGRRPLAGDVPSQVGLVVDLTAEFPANRTVRQSASYVCLPTLDTGTANDNDFAGLVAQIAASPSPVYIHCAAGHGRSASMMAAVLIVKGLAADVKAAEAMIRRIRPGVRLHEHQREQVRLITHMLLAAAKTPK